MNIRINKRDVVAKIESELVEVNNITALNKNGGLNIYVTEIGDWKEHVIKLLKSTIDFESRFLEEA